MPSVESGAGDVQSMWSSFDYGLIHFVLIDTETDFDGSPEGGSMSSPLLTLVFVNLYAR